jgi:hypothetical protein
VALIGEGLRAREDISGDDWNAAIGSLVDGLETRGVALCRIDGAAAD